MSIDRFLVKENFFAEADKLRAVFDDHFSDPNAEDPTPQFVWGYWHIPGAYSFIRTSPEEFFPTELYASFLAALTEFARQHLGLSLVMPASLSFYLPGCRQELHNDVGNGSWGFVYSLTSSYGRSLGGGETIFVKDDYWHSSTMMELSNPRAVTTLVPPLFNQLLVFDDRLIHGVRQVQNQSMDPKDARIVIHGHLRSGGPFVDGGHAEARVIECLEEQLPRLNEQIADFGELDGLITVRLQVNRTGKVDRVEPLLNTLRRISMEGASDPAKLTEIIRSFVETLEFGKAEAASQVTIPFPITVD